MEFNTEQAAIKLAKLMYLKKGTKKSAPINLPDKCVSYFNNPESVDLSSDKVGFSIEEALQLESALQHVFDSVERAKGKAAYSKSDTRKVIDSHSDQVKPKRSVSDVLNACVEIAMATKKLQK